MRLFAILILVLTSFASSAQNEQLAQYYFDKGEFEKSIIAYEELLEGQPTNPYYFQKLVESRQQMQQLDKSQELLEDRIATYRQAHLLAELGYNYQLQKNAAKAKLHYEEAIDRVRKNPHEVYQVAAVFEKRVLVDYA